MQRCLLGASSMRTRFGLGFPGRLGSVFVAWVLLGCGTEVVRPEQTSFGGSWSSGWPQLRHDGKPFESANFMVFSEASSQPARTDMADLAESVLSEIKTQMDITHADFDFLPSYESEKIHIMADYDQMAWSGFAYRDGIIIRALDSPRWTAAGHTPESFRGLMHHELTHVVEFLLIGDPRYQQANTVWLREGFANYNSGPRPSTITTVDQVEAWRAKMSAVPGGGNPIGIRVWGDFPASVLEPNTTIEYYPFFELATAYLLDPAGQGGAIADLKALYDDLGAGLGVDRALRDRFDLDVNDFEERFWDIMVDYLGGPSPE